MRIRIALFFATLSANAAAATPELPAAADVSAIRDKLTIWADDKKHFIALVMTSKSDSPMFWSRDGETFFKLRRTGGSSDGYDDDLKKLDRSFWEPRDRGVSGEAAVSYSKESQKLTVRCGLRTTLMGKLDAQAATKLISAAVFKEPRWGRYAYALARDDVGTYYYVDNVREPEGAKNFRLFAGPKGGMKLQKMINVVSDSQGDIFSTKNGALRLLLSKQASTWTAHQKLTKLTWLSVDDNRFMIYQELGVYTAEALGTPCDEL